MTTPVVLFGVFAFLTAFNAGTMTTLQIQHYGIYPLVGREHFARYIRANNRAAVVPAILPAIVLMATSMLLVIAPPPFMSLGEALVAVGLNAAQLASTVIWQRRLQAEMAKTGYDDAKTRLLLSTNWIRTAAFLLQAVLATTILVRALGHLSRTDSITETELHTRAPYGASNAGESRRACDERAHGVRSDPCAS